MVLHGIDIGTSFIKTSVLDAGTCQVITSAKYPEKEAAIITDGSTGALLVPVYLMCERCICKFETIADYISIKNNAI